MSDAPPVITIDDYELDTVCQFTYLGSTITDNLSLDAEIDKMIGKAASTIDRLSHSSIVDTHQAVGEDEDVCLQRLCMFPVHCCMAARHGLHVPGRRED